MTWLKRQGANKVADLNQLRPGTYTCKDLADGLSMPMLKAQRLLSALEGTNSSAIHRREHRFCDSPLHDRCSAAALAPACCASATSPQGTVLRVPPDPITRPVHTVLRVLPGCPPRSPRHSTQSVPCEYSEYPQQPEPTITKTRARNGAFDLLGCARAACHEPGSQHARAGQCRV